MYARQALYKQTPLFSLFFVMGYYIGYREASQQLYNNTFLLRALRDRSDHVRSFHHQAESIDGSCTPFVTLTSTSNERVIQYHRVGRVLNSCSSHKIEKRLTQRGRFFFPSNITFPIQN